MRALFLILAGTWGVAATFQSGKYCFEGCLYALGCVTFNDTSPVLSRKIRTCKSALRATSLFLCIHNYCNVDGRTEWLNGQNGTCQKTTGIDLPPYDVISKYLGDVGGVRRLTAEEGFCDENAVTLGEVTIPDERYFERAFRTLEAAFDVEGIHWLYAMCMYYFWGIVISIGICTRLLSLIRGLESQEWMHIPDSESNNVNNELKEPSIRALPYALLKRFIIIPATFGYRCSQNIGWCTIPPRIQSLTITSFVLLNIVFCTCSYPVIEGNIFWPKLSTQYWRYVSDRTGIISMANLPLIWLFGTRNNTLIWLTGWGFGTYNNFHRWVARVATVQAVVHSIGYTEMIWESGGWNTYLKYWTKWYFWNGELATIFMCAICVFSVYGIRRSNYEIFLVTHIILSILVLVTMYYHVEIFNGEWNIFLWPSLSIWLFDRLLRAIRILAFNWRFWNKICEVTYNSHSNLVRLEVPCSQSFLMPKPGSYYYIYALDNLLYAHQSHPFTLAYVASNDDAEDLEMHARTSSPSSAASTESLESEALLPHKPISSNSPSSSLVFLIRPYNGFTSRLCRSSTHAPSSLRILLEGPYGSTAPLRTYPSILFLVGGTGIAAPLSYLTHLLSSPSSRVRRLRIVWAVREHAFFMDVLAKFEELLRDERVEVDVHVTRDEEGKDDQVAEGLEGVGLLAGRPDVDEEVEKICSGSGRRNGRMAVVACGPSMMADQTRRACVRAVRDGYSGLEYFEESFKW